MTFEDGTTTYRGVSYKARRNTTTGDVHRDVGTIGVKLSAPVAAGEARTFKVKRAAVAPDAPRKTPRRRRKATDAGDK